MNILGIGGLLGHDANAALIMDNEIISASQEERFSRIKHDAAFPIKAITDCLKAGNIGFEDIALVVLAEKPLQVYFSNNSYRVPSRLVNKVSNNKLIRKLTLSLYEKEILKLFPNAKVEYSWHHLSHALSSYYSGGFEEAAFLCIDGKGEFANASIGFIDRKNAAIHYELAYGNGLGMLYTLLTHFLGFNAFGSEYKVMGLAPYGKPVFADAIKKLYREEGPGAVRLLKESTFHPNDLVKLFPWVSSVLGFRNRVAGEELDTVYLDLAASLQFVFEEIVLKIAAFAKSKFNTPNLIFCGGCAQNCVAAGKLRDSKIFENVYNSPVGGDMGSGLGAALAHLHHNQLTDRSKLNFKGFYLGSGPGTLSVENAAGHEIPLRRDDLLSYMAKELSDGKIIGWVHDGMELGARALGARSILANPLVPGIQSEMNLKIKFRESFRPFAPAILREDAADWFEVDQPSDFMQFTAFLKQGLRFKTPVQFSSFKEQLNYPRCKIPSVVHVDYSARLQTISVEVHPEFYLLLKEFKGITGVPILINTSFNVNGQPIVRTADEAWECFINTDIDLLVIGRKIYKNPFDRTKEQKLIWMAQFEKYSK
jgi:carbamoyltransferase